MILIAFIILGVISAWLVVRNDKDGSRFAGVCEEITASGYPAASSPALPKCVKEVESEARPPKLFGIMFQQEIKKP